MKQSKRFPFLWVGQCSRLWTREQLFIADDFGNYRLVDYNKLSVFGAQSH